MRSDSKDLKAEREVWEAYAGASVRGYGRIVSAPPKVGVKVVIRMWGVMPAGRPKRCGDMECHTYKPDADNAAKCILDGLNPKRRIEAKTGRVIEDRIGAWADDSQVVELIVVKVGRFRGSEERTEVTVEWPCGKDGN